MPSEVDEIIQQIPNWGSAKNIQIESLGGLTNKNYLVTVAGEKFVLHISGQNTARLGINREEALGCQSAVAKAGIGPQVAHFIRPEGHLVTRYIPGRHLTLDEYRTQQNLRRIMDTVKRMHALPLVEATFSPFQRVADYAQQAQSMGVPFPLDFDQLIHKMRAIKGEQARDTSPWQKFCHNDLFSVNVVDDGQIWFLDWEFAGVGDIYFDLATLLYAYDSPDTLSPELQAFVLECYFGEVSTTNWSRLAGMRYMIMFFCAMWGLLQQGLYQAGLVQAIAGFDYFEYAQVNFAAMRNFIFEHEFGSSHPAG